MGNVSLTIRKHLNNFRCSRTTYKDLVNNEKLTLSYICENVHF